MLGVDFINHGWCQSDLSLFLCHGWDLASALSVWPPSTMATEPPLPGLITSILVLHGLMPVCLQQARTCMWGCRTASWVSSGSSQVGQLEKPYFKADLEWCILKPYLAAHRLPTTFLSLQSFAVHQEKLGLKAWSLTSIRLVPGAVPAIVIPAGYSH